MDLEDLKKRLRAKTFSLLCRNAAEAIERLQAENAALKAERDAKQWYPFQMDDSPK